MLWLKLTHLGSLCTGSRSQGSLGPSLPAAPPPNHSHPGPSSHRHGRDAGPLTDAHHPLGPSGNLSAASPLVSRRKPGTSRPWHLSPPSSTPPPGLLLALVILNLQGATGQRTRTISVPLAGCGECPKSGGSPRQPTPQPSSVLDAHPLACPGACPAHRPAGGSLQGSPLQLLQAQNLPTPATRDLTRHSRNS